MDFLSLFQRSSPKTPKLLYFGSFTVDRNGRIISSTLPQASGTEDTQAIASAVLETFHQAEASELPLRELNLEFACMRVTARELRGGALIFLSPRHGSPQGSSNFNIPTLTPPIS